MGPICFPYVPLYSSKFYDSIFQITSSTNFQSQQKRTVENFWYATIVFIFMFPLSMATSLITILNFQQPLDGRRLQQNYINRCLSESPHIILDNSAW